MRSKQATCRDIEQMVQNCAMRIILFFEKILRIIYSLKTLWRGWSVNIVLGFKTFLNHINLKDNRHYSTWEELLYLQISFLWIADSVNGITSHFNSKIFLGLVYDIIDRLYKRLDRIFLILKLFESYNSFKI